MSGFLVPCEVLVYSLMLVRHLLPISLNKTANGEVALKQYEEVSTLTRAACYHDRDLNHRFSQSDLTTELWVKGCHK